MEYGGIGGLGIEPSGFIPFIRNATASASFGNVGRPRIGDAKSAQTGMGIVGANPMGAPASHCPRSNEPSMFRGEWQSAHRLTDSTRYRPRSILEAVAEEEAKTDNAPAAVRSITANSAAIALNRLTGFMIYWIGAHHFAGAVPELVFADMSRHSKDMPRSQLPRFCIKQSPGWDPQVPLVGSKTAWSSIWPRDPSRRTVPMFRGGLPPPPRAVQSCSAAPARDSALPYPFILIAGCPISSPWPRLIPDPRTAATSGTARVSDARTTPALRRPPVSPPARGA